MIESKKDYRMLGKSIEDYINICDEKSKYHDKNSINSSQCWNFYNIFNTSLSALSTLTITVLGILEIDAKYVAIVGASFSFAVLVFNRIQMNFQYNALSINHGILNDDYLDLKEQFEMLLMDIDDKHYEQCVKRFSSINEKSHIPSVKNCGLGNIC